MNAEQREPSPWAQNLAARYSVSIRLESPTPGNVPAYKYEEGKERTVIIDSTLPHERQNFSLAHEIAHILLEHTGKISPDEEFQANRKASELMFPREMFQPVAENSLRELKLQFPHASFEAIARRKLQFVPGVLTIFDNERMTLRIHSAGFNAPKQLTVPERELVGQCYREKCDLEITAEGLHLSGTYVDEGRGFRRVLLFVQQDEFL